MLWSDTTCLASGHKNFVYAAKYSGLVESTREELSESETMNC